MLASRVGLHSWSTKARPIISQYCHIPIKHLNGSFAVKDPLSANSTTADAFFFKVNLTYCALLLKDIGVSPGGAPKTFCDPV